MRATRARLVVLSLVVGAGFGCGEEFQPATFVNRLRVLSVVAEPPDVLPGGSSELSALVVDPSEPGRKTTQIWLACDPDPKGLESGPCSKIETLSEPEELAAAAGETGIRPIGLGPGARYTAPAGIFDELPADHVLRRRGVLALVMLMVVGEEVTDFTKENLDAVFERVKNKELPAVTVLKRVRITEEEQRNANPKIKGVTVGGELFPPGARPVRLHPGETYTFTGNAQEGSAEHFVQLDLDGNATERDENLAFSWFATAGRLIVPRSPAEEDKQRYVTPFVFQLMPPDRAATMWVVLRDGRGGAAFASRGLYFCDYQLPAVSVEAVTPEQPKAGQRLTLSGANLEQILDADVNGIVLAQPRLSDDRKTWSGILASATPAGENRIRVRQKGCAPDLAVAIQVQP